MDENTLKSRATEPVKSVKTETAPDQLFHMLTKMIVETACKAELTVPYMRITSPRRSPSMRRCCSAITARLS